MDPQAIIRDLAMRPHPEGGHYVETYARREGGDRGPLTAIYFLLRAGERSRWHRVDATEAWLWHAGDALALRIKEPEGRRGVVLGVDLDQGQRPQAVVPAGCWQTAACLGAWTLVSCVVAPGFTFEGFELPEDPDFEP